MDNRCSARWACSGVGFAARAQAMAMSNRLGIFMETWIKDENMTCSLLRCYLDGFFNFLRHAMHVPGFFSSLVHS
jgi:hypothetical protein